MIEQLIAEGAARTRLNPRQVERTLSGALGLMHKHAAREKLEELYEALPGSRPLGESGARELGKGGGFLGGMMKAAGGAGGAAMADGLAMQGRLRKEGVGDDDLKALLPIAMDWVRARTGRDLLREVAETIPGLGGMLAGRR